MEKIKKYLIGAGPDAWEEAGLRALQVLFNQQVMGSPAWAIGSTTTLPANAAPIVAVANGILMYKAANAVGISFTSGYAGWTLGANAWGIGYITLDLAGNFYFYGGNGAAAVGSVVPPTVPEMSPGGAPQAVVGGLLVQAAAGGFVAGTTALSANTVTAYLNIASGTYATPQF